MSVTIGSSRMPRLTPRTRTRSPGHPNPSGKRTAWLRPGIKILARPASDMTFPRAIYTRDIYHRRPRDKVSTRGALLQPLAARDAGSRRPVQKPREERSRIACTIRVPLLLTNRFDLDDQRP